MKMDKTTDKDLLKTDYGIDWGSIKPSYPFMMEDLLKLNPPSPTYGYWMSAGYVPNNPYTYGGNYLNTNNVFDQYIVPLIEKIDNTINDLESASFVNAEDRQSVKNILSILQCTKILLDGQRRD